MQTTIFDFNTTELSTGASKEANLTTAIDSKKSKRMAKNMSVLDKTEPTATVTLSKSENNMSEEELVNFYTNDIDLDNDLLDCDCPLY